MALCLVGLGANVGDRPATLARAIAQMAALPQTELRAQSAWHETPAVGGPAHQPPYLNAAACLATTLTPPALLAALQQIEIDLGRVRSERWGPRTIDLDLLLYDDQVLHSAELTIPHPRMAFRRFVVEPVAEIAADVRHPTIQWTMRQLCEHLRHARPYVAVTGRPAVGKTALAARLAAQCPARFLADPRSQLPAIGLHGDSAGRLYEREIELLGLRAALLTGKEGPQPGALTISDFWLEQSLAYVAAWEERKPREDFASALAAASQSATRPKLLVVLDPPENPGTAAAQPAPTQSAALGRALADAARRPGVGPLLYLTNDNLAANEAELAAAIGAMT